MPLVAVVAALASRSASSFLGIRLQTDTHRRTGFAVVAGVYVFSWRQTSSSGGNWTAVGTLPKNINAWPFVYSNQIEKGVRWRRSRQRTLS